ncbi:hypothetical protein MK139_17455 [bacterium]|nr:hypothetical protein [bacterium]
MVSVTDYCIEVYPFLDQIINEMSVGLGMVQGKKVAGGTRVWSSPQGLSGSKRATDCIWCIQCRAVGLGSETQIMNYSAIDHEPANETMHELNKRTR